MTSLFVVGSLHWDVVVNAPSIPRHDETIVGHSVNYAFGGKGGNQAIAANQHGAMTHFAGRIGQDAFGAQILNRLKQTTIVLDSLQNGNGPSGMSVAIVDKSGEYGATIVSGENLNIDVDAIQLPHNVNVVLLQNEISEKVNSTIAKRAKDCGAEVWLNGAPARVLSAELINILDVLIVNRLEAAFYKKHLSDSDLRKLTVIETLGGSGVIFHQFGKDPYRQNAFEVEVLSTHGAGDMFSGALAARYLMGQTMYKAISYAQAAAALHVCTPLEKRGKVTPEHVLALMNKKLSY